jgi:hypothetical protein
MMLAAARLKIEGSRIYLPLKPPPPRPRLGLSSLCPPRRARFVAIKQLGVAAILPTIDASKVVASTMKTCVLSPMIAVQYTLSQILTAEDFRLLHWVDAVSHSGQATEASS